MPVWPGTGIKILLHQMPKSSLCKSLADPYTPETLLLEWVCVCTSW